MHKKVRISLQNTLNSCLVQVCAHRKVNPLHHLRKWAPKLMMKKDSIKILTMRWKSSLLSKTKRRSMTRCKTTAMPMMTMLTARLTSN